MTTQKIEQPSNPISMPPVDPEVISLGMDVAVLLAIAFAVYARDNLKKAVAKISAEQFANKFPLDKNHQAKLKLIGLLTALRTVAESDHASLGILHNGSFSEWGYSFSKVTWEIETKDKNLVSLLPRLKETPVSYWIAKVKGWSHVGNYLVYPIFIGSTQIAVIALACFDEACSPPAPENTSKITNQIAEVLLENFINKSTEW